MSGGARLEAAGLAKRFDGIEALGGVDLELPPGGFTSLLGPSGCGKSTLLRLIAGLERPSAGRIAWPEGAPGRGEIGFVFQEPTLMPWASVFDNVWLPRRIAGQSRARAKPAIDEALSMLGLAEFAGAKPDALSGGMKMRCSIARALVTRPRLLLMDEPFSALDEILRFRLAGELSELWRRRGWSVLFVTHSVYESVFLSERICVMSARPGRIATILEIDEPFPRTEAFRGSARYAARCRDVSAALRAAMA